MVDTKVLELLCSRLCHELISPVSAIGNGVELMGDDPGGMLGEIIALLAHSSGQASQRLKFYRIAYGLGGDMAESMGLGDAGALVGGLIEDDGVKLSWPEGAGPIGHPAIKVLLNAAVLALEALPRGGELAVRVEAGDAVDLELTATGPDVRLREECVAALDCGATSDALTPRSVHAWFTRHLAERAGGTFAIDGTAARSLTLRAHIPVSH